MPKERKPTRQRGKVREQARIPLLQNKQTEKLFRAAVSAPKSLGKFLWKYKLSTPSPPMSSWGVGPTEKPHFPFEMELMWSAEERERQAKSQTAHGLSALSHQHTNG